MRQSLEFKIENPALFKSQLLNWAQHIERVCFLNSNAETINLKEIQSYSSFDLLVGVDSIAQLSCSSSAAFDELKKFYATKSDWLFGYLSYDLKNEIEKLGSNNGDGLNFPELHFFQPKYVFLLKGEKLKIEFLLAYSTVPEITSLFESILAVEIKPTKHIIEKIQIQAKLSKDDYLNKVDEIKSHIQRGDVYELNFCMEFFLQNHQLEAKSLYERLNEISQTPFSCFFRNHENFLLCASPERFLKKQGGKLISQPIKGTRKRGLTEAEDKGLKAELLSDLKERNENVMIVDLVRNDLSRSAKRGTVKVEELFGVYTFKQVHQLISTVSCEIKAEIHFIDALKNAFPMGSMTGAPKVRAMQLIEEFEWSKRGLYSGTIGYISPSGDFDFNVVIRSILHNAKNKYTSFMVGSAITANCDAEQEYEECLLKAAALFQVLTGSSS